tara:strand:+ start:255 stop:410 length:156 start_codon:yes stop_codon:yes gene_type:complete
LDKFKEVAPIKKVNILPATPDNQIEEIKPEKAMVSVNVKRVSKIVFNQNKS